jgi:hypothetical protein
MKLITKEILGKLEKNPRDHSSNKPWLKLFNPVGAETWLISEIEADGDTLFGLCDLGWGHPELGNVSLNELESLALPFGLKIERDMYFEPTKTLAEYAADARTAGRIDTNGGA